MRAVPARSGQQPAWPMLSGHVLRREFEYERQDPLSFIVPFEVTAGRGGPLSAGSTHNAAHCLAAGRRSLEANPRIVHWHFVVDNLNTHHSEPLGR
jgi:hypothetical protein